MTTALERSEWSAAHPGCTVPLGRTQYPLYRRLGGPQGRSGWVENLIPLGFDPWTIQPIVSRYTNWATQPTTTNSAFSKIYMYNNKLTNTHQKDVKCLQWLTLEHSKLTIIYISKCRPASWSSRHGFWLLIMRSQVRFPALPWAFFLVGEDPHGNHGLGS